MSTGPVLSRAAIRAVDERAIRELGIPGVVLMENAGRGAAEVLIARAPRRVVCLCGPGNNGGDAYVVARHVANEGIGVRLVHLQAHERARGDAAVMREITRRMGIEACDASGVHEPDPAATLAGADWIVDGMLGTGFEGAVREPLATWIRAANSARAGGASILALDLPSGLDCDTGEASEPTVVADRTVTFAALKPGLVAPAARGFVGDLSVASIGVPASLLADR